MKNTAHLKALKEHLARLDADAANELATTQFLGSVYHNQFAQDLQFKTGIYRAAMHLGVALFYDFHTGLPDSGAVEKFIKEHSFPKLNAAFEARHPHCAKKAA